MKRKAYNLLALSFLLSALPLTACDNAVRKGNGNEHVLRVASWDEYIDEGGEDSYAEGSDALYDEFCSWYYEQTGKEITVEYIELQDNESMYNKIKMGDSYDLLCPSEYMIMKLETEGYLQKLPSSFFDTTTETNYYAKYVSPYIQDVFDNLTLKNGEPMSAYAAGYMWGSTGFVYNPEHIGNTPEESREIMSSWNAFTSPDCKRKITAKDNVRDSYFSGLGMYYETELLALAEDYKSGKITLAEYKTTLSEKMNDTSAATMSGVKEKLIGMRRNLYGLETDEGKNAIITGELDASYQWSGDAVYILDEAEAYESAPVYLEYSVPKSASNLWFDGYVMMKGANVEASLAFINFLSMPENAVRNSYYIGYTSCIGGDEMFSYIEETYGDEEGDTEYDLSYFFGNGYTLTTTAEQTRRQLFAQYPDSETINRLVVMEYFDQKANENANRMWNNIK